MAYTGRRGGPRGQDEGDRDQGDREREQYREHERDHEPYDGPAEHLEIERRRVAGGLPPTPGNRYHYSRARA